MNTSESVQYHEGELRVQRRAGTEDPQSPWSRAVRRTMSEKVMDRVEAADLAVIATLDEDGYPWAWPLAGEPGMVKALGPTLLRVLPAAPPPLELAWQIVRNPAIGVLSLSLERRLRARVNGRAIGAGGARLAIAVEEAFTNCPKFIRPRTRSRSAPAACAIASTGPALSQTQLETIRRSDTFFIASRNREGRLDASHRGGEPGFVTVASPRLLEFPDYVGNGMFQTIGNLVEDGRAGLLFIDFEAGTWLQLVVDAIPSFGNAAPDRAVSDRRVRCRIVGVFEGSGLPCHWATVDQEPHSPGQP